MTTTKLITADDLLMMPRDDYQYELVRGELTEKMPPPGELHGDVTGRFSFELRAYSRANGFGVVRDNVGFRLESDPDTVRAPDVAWIAPGRSGEPIPGYPQLTPDLVVEIKSPTDTRRMVAERAQMWLDFGSREVWYGDPETTTVTQVIGPVNRSQSPYREHDVLDGGDLLPGFSFPVWQLFRDQP